MPDLDELLLGFICLKLRSIFISIRIVLSDHFPIVRQTVVHLIIMQQ